VGGAGLDVDRRQAPGQALIDSRLFVGGGVSVIVSVLTQCIRCPHRIRPGSRYS
jgi:hypothetical protein